jgi:hypothetical protein
MLDIAIRARLPFDQIIQATDSLLKSDLRLIGPWAGARHAIRPDQQGSRRTQRGGSSSFGLVG